MHKLSLLFGLLSSATLSFAAALPRSADQNANRQGYIVTLDNDVPQGDFIEVVISILGGILGDSITRQWNPTFLNAFAGNFDENTIDALRARKEVRSVEPDITMSAFEVQTDASWNLARMSARAKLGNQDPFALNYEYNYLPNPGKDVDIYVVDTGIYIEHPDFEDRAQWGGAFCPGCAQRDGNGHGTHVAGTAGGKRSGIAKAANLIAVKVLGDNGSGSLSGIIDGLEWVYLRHELNKDRPSIATMSWGGSNSLVIDAAVRKLVEAGIHCTVAAGNSNEDAKDTSPANTPEVITVGATDITDSRAFYSNYGPVVDIFAPGSNVTSTWNDGGYKTISGTSMATPAVAGLVAYFLNVAQKNISPADMRNYITRLATRDALSNIPDGTDNLLAFNGYGSY